MADLYPLSLSHHLQRIYHEMRTSRQIFDLPEARFYKGHPHLDASVLFHGEKASTALGPAAGPQDQMIQNIVLAWLGGSRIVELKTVQILDELKIPRPCISAANIGFNVEWSQELRIAQSLREYVGASMALQILREEDVLGLGERSAELTRTIFDMSVGYDLKGISSPQVTGFLRSMMDATAIVDELRAQIPDVYGAYRDFAFDPRISKSITLSTFHGCPPDEIERIVAYLLTEVGVNTIIKLNPTQLGKERLEHLLYDVMGYSHLEVNQKAYAAGLSLDEAVGIVERLAPVAEARGLRLGVKFSNTLETINKGNYFSDEVAYMSGPPLHVIAMNLVGEWRKVMGTRFPVSFSAGIDHDNFYHAVSLGIVPVTVCTDLLKPRGYGRQITYLKNLEEKMLACGAVDVDEYILRSRGHASVALTQAIAGSSLSGEQKAALEAACQQALAQPQSRICASAQAWAVEAGVDPALAVSVFEQSVQLASLANTQDYVAEVTDDPRYRHAKNKALPKKIGSHLYLFDCISCDKCVPVCPNDANFVYEVAPIDASYRNLRLTDTGVWPEEEQVYRITRAHQIANYADFCNECGNCDAFCPEYGGPYIMKPRFFSTVETYAHHGDRDGFLVEVGEGVRRIRGRIQGKEYFLEEHLEEAYVFSDGVLEVGIQGPDAKVTQTRVLQEQFGHVTDLRTYFQLRLLLHGVLAPKLINYVNVVHNAPGLESLPDQVADAQAVPASV